MSSSQLFITKAGGVSIRFICGSGSFLNFLREALASPGDFSPPIPDMTLRIGPMDQRAQAPSFEPGACRLIEESPHHRIFLSRGRFVHERGLQNLTSAGIWNYGKGGGEVRFAEPPRIEEIRVVAFSLLREGLKEHGLFPLHAAALTKEGKTVLLPADGNTGKTAAAIALLRRGFRLISDDTVLLSREGNSLTAAGFPEKPRIGRHHLDLFPGIRFPKTAPGIPGIPKWHFRASDVFPDSSAAFGIPTHLFFLRGRRRPYQRRLTREEACSRLERHLSYRDSTRASGGRYQEHVRALSRSCEAHEIDEADPFELACLIERLSEGSVKIR